MQSTNNQLTWSLDGTNLILIVSNAKHQEMHQLRLSIDQASFPFTFKVPLGREIQEDAYYLMALLVFGFPHRLLWECVLFQQYIRVHQVNDINFTVMDVCK